MSISYTFKKVFIAVLLPVLLSTFSSISHSALINKNFNLDLNTLIEPSPGFGWYHSSNTPLTTSAFNFNPGDILTTTTNFLSGQSITVNGGITFVTMYQDSNKPSGSPERQASHTTELTFFTNNGDVTFNAGKNGFGGTMFQSTDPRYASTTSPITFTGYRMVSEGKNSLTYGHTWDQYFINYLKADQISLDFVPTIEPTVISVSNFEAQAEGSPVADNNAWTTAGNGTATVTGGGSAMKMSVANPDNTAPVITSTTIDTLGMSSFDLMFDVLFETSTGRLELFLDNDWLDTLYAANYFGLGLTSYSTTITDAKYLNRTGVGLDFRLFPGSPATVVIDDISLSATNSVPNPSSIILLSLGFLLFSINNRIKLNS